MVDHKVSDRARILSTNKHKIWRKIQDNIGNTQWGLL